MNDEGRIIQVAFWVSIVVLLVIVIGLWNKIFWEMSVSDEERSTYNKYASLMKETYDQMGKCKQDPEKINNSNIECLLFVDKRIETLRYQLDEQTLDNISKEGKWEDISPGTVRELDKEISKFIPLLIKGERVEM